VEHCYKIGYRRIGIVIGESRNSLVKERYDGFLAAIKNFGLETDEQLLKHCPLDAESGYFMTEELLRLPESPRCILAMDNVLTLGVIRALKTHDIRIPDEIAFISMDDIANGELVEPRVTYVGQPIDEIANRIFNMLTVKIDAWNNNDAFNDKRAERQIVNVPVELVIRDSCGHKRKIPACGE
jgi:DNA-binding LacI/PurR family transcriptional regulator